MDISAADLVYVITRSQSQGVAPKKVVDVTLQINPLGNDRKYPDLGVPLDKALLGCPNVVESIIIVDSTDSDNVAAGSADGFVYKVDMKNLTIRVLLETNDGGGPVASVEKRLSTNNDMSSPSFLKLRVYGW